MPRTYRKTSRWDRKPSRRHRREIRQTTKYDDIRRCLGASDHDALVLCGLSEIHHVEVGHALNGPAWRRAHVVVGLSAVLRLQTTVYVSDEEQAIGELDISAPWIVKNLDREGGRLWVSQPGLVLTIDRRHLHLVERILLGRVEPVGPIAVAFRLVRPAEKPAPAASRS